MAILQFFQLISCPSQGIYHRVKFGVSTEDDLHLGSIFRRLTNSGIHVCAAKILNTYICPAAVTGISALVSVCSDCDPKSIEGTELRSMEYAASVLII